MGTPVGSPVGRAVGPSEGRSVGRLVGSSVGCPVGCSVGVPVGSGVASTTMTNGNPSRLKAAMRPRRNRNLLEELLIFRVEAPIAACLTFPFLAVVVFVGYCNGGKVRIPLRKIFGS